MELWKKVFCEGFAPHIETHRLQGLASALEKDDIRLLQGATTTPPPLPSIEDCPVEAACAMTFCGWLGEDMTVGQAEEYFANLCFQADQEIGQPAACRHFLNWHDDTPRAEMQSALLSAVREVLDKREGVNAAAV